MHPEECTYNITDELRKLHGRVFKAQRFIKACTLSKALTWPMQKQNAQSSRIVSECTPIELTKASARAKVVYNGSSVTCSQSPHTFSLSPPPTHTHIHSYINISASILPQCFAFGATAKCKACINVLSAPSPVLPS